MQTLNPKLSSQPCKPQRENSENMFPKNLSVGVGVLLDFDADFVCVALQTTSEKKNWKRRISREGGGPFFLWRLVPKNRETQKKEKNIGKDAQKAFLQQQGREI